MIIIKYTMIFFLIGLRPIPGCSYSRKKLTNHQLEILTRSRQHIAYLSGRDKEQFLKWRVDVYEKSKWDGHTLCENFASDFAHFSKHDFNSCQIDQLRRLRDVLLKRDVNLKIVQGSKIGKVLREAVKEELKGAE